MDKDVMQDASSVPQTDIVPCIEQYQTDQRRTFNWMQVFVYTPVERGKAWHIGSVPARAPKPSSRVRTSPSISLKPYCEVISKMTSSIKLSLFRSVGSKLTVPTLNLRVGDLGTTLVRI